MKLEKFLRSLVVDHPSLNRRPSVRDSQLDALIATLEGGARPRSCVYSPLGAGALRQPCLLFTLRADGRDRSLAVAVHHESIAYCRLRLGNVNVACLVDPEPTTSERVVETGLAEELRRLFDHAVGTPEARAARLMDWCMNRIDASRCALIPFEAGAACAPLAFHMRQGAHGGLPLTHVPRRVIAHVARTRQPIAVRDARASDAPVGLSESLIEQDVRSYLAVPVVFRGELLAVCYVDRLDRAAPFDTEQQRAFEAFAYELAMPLLGLREQRRRGEFTALRNARLEDRDEQGAAWSPALEGTLDRVYRMAPHRDVNVLILGETGSGKEVVARLLHDAAGPKEAPFVAVNISALSSALFESDLMGSVRGAFTGAVDRPGRVAQAEGGTLFLDELGDLELGNQVKLLRFLQDRMATPVGSTSSREADVRVVAATNRNLDELLASGEFRADLFHRFAPPLRVPPLRERRDEIPSHAARWLRDQALNRGLPLPTLTSDAERFLLEHPWPGNVRQLQAVLSTALVLAPESAIDRELLTELAPVGASTRATARTLSELRDEQAATERQWLSERLAEHAGKVEPTARAVGCPASTLRNLVMKHGLRRD